jgi:hypothetical protein
LCYESSGYRGYRVAAAACTGNTGGNARVVGG